MRPTRLGDDNAVGVAGRLDTLDLVLYKRTGILRLRVCIEEGVAVDHDHVRGLADCGIVKHGWHSLDRANGTIITKASELTSSALNRINNSRGS